MDGVFSDPCEGCSKHTKGSAIKTNRAFMSAAFKGAFYFQVNWVHNVTTVSDLGGFPLGDATRKALSPACFLK